MLQENLRVYGVVKVNIDTRITHGCGVRDVETIREIDWMLCK